MIHLRCSHWWLELESTTWTRIVSVRSSFWHFDFWVLHRQAKELPFTQLNTRLTHGHWTFGSDHTHANSQLKLSSNFITYDKPISQICLLCCLLRCSAGRSPRRRAFTGRRPAPPPIAACPRPTAARRPRAAEPELPNPTTSGGEGKARGGERARGRGRPRERKRDREKKEKTDSGLLGFGLLAFA